jgi:hypothetical protein
MFQFGLHMMHAIFENISSLSPAISEPFDDTSTQLRLVQVVLLAILIPHKSEQSDNGCKEAVAITADGHERQVV